MLKAPFFVSLQPRNCTEFPNPPTPGLVVAGPAFPWALWVPEAVPALPPEENSPAAAWVQGWDSWSLWPSPDHHHTSALYTSLGVWGRGLGGWNPELGPLVFLLWLKLVGGMNKKVTDLDMCKKKKKRGREMKNTLWNCVFKLISKSWLEVCLFIDLFILSRTWLENCVLNESPWS